MEDETGNASSLALTTERIGVGTMEPQAGFHVGGNGLAGIVVIEREGGKGISPKPEQGR